MINNWLEENKREDEIYSFEIIDIIEKALCNEETKEYLGNIIFESYRNKIHLIRRFSGKSRQEVIDYLNTYVFPSKNDQITQNVKQGDFGEILTIDIIEKFRDLEVPIYKMRWKFNNNKSVFATDILAHNKDTEITDLRYYEVKTRRSYSKSVGKKAHDGLKKDIPNQHIADFLDRYYLEQAEILYAKGKEEEANEFYEKADKYGDIVQNSSKYNCSFEIVLIFEKSIFKQAIVDELNSVSSMLEPLGLTIILVDNLNDLVECSYNKAIDFGIELVCGDKDE